MCRPRAGWGRSRLLGKAGRGIRGGSLRCPARCPAPGRSGKTKGLTTLWDLAAAPVRALAVPAGAGRATAGRWRRLTLMSRDGRRCAARVAVPEGLAGTAVCPKPVMADGRHTMRPGNW